MTRPAQSQACRLLPPESSPPRRRRGGQPGNTNRLKHGGFSRYARARREAVRRLILYCDFLILQAKAWHACEIARTAAAEARPALSSPACGRRSFSEGGRKRGRTMRPGYLQQMLSAKPASMSLPYNHCHRQRARPLPPPGESAPPRELGTPASGRSARRTARSLGPTRGRRAESYPKIITDSIRHCGIKKSKYRIL
jgi:hypothetical protein